MESSLKKILDRISTGVCLVRFHLYISQNQVLLKSFKIKNLIAKVDEQLLKC